MASCTVLGDSMVRGLLLDLSRENITRFMKELEKAIESFSRPEERKLQPHPSVVKRPDGRKTLFRPFSSNGGPGVKIIVDPAAALTQTAGQINTPNGPQKSKPTLHGILAICDQDGLPTGLLNAEEITAFRTALSVMIPYSWRKFTEHIVIFGAGKVALWHLRLVCRLRGADIKTITITNRSVERSRAMVDQLQKEGLEQWGYTGGFDILDPAQSNHEEVLGEALAIADVVFCTTPSKAPLFRAAQLSLGGEGRRAPCISAIGSWTADMIEVDPDVFALAAIRRTEDGDHASGLIIADDSEGALKDSGEFVQSRLRAEQITELGELLAMRAGRSDQFSNLHAQYLSEGLVVYKSIGVSLTDLAAGQALLALAKDRGIGLSLSDF